MHSRTLVIALVHSMLPVVLCVVCCSHFDVESAPHCSIAHTSESRTTSSDYSERGKQPSTERLMRIAALRGSRVRLQFDV